MFKIFPFFESLFPLDPLGPGSSLPKPVLCPRLADVQIPRVPLDVCCFIIFSTIMETPCTRVPPLAPRPPSGGMSRVPQSPGHPCSLGLHFKIRYFSCTINRMGTQLKYVWVQLGTNGASEPHKATFFLQPPTKKLDTPY